MKPSGKYGLIVPKKELSAPKAGNIFGDDDSDEENGKDCFGKGKMKVLTENVRSKKQTKLNIQKALEVDPTIFQYDEVYDDIEKSKKEEIVNVKKEVKTAKYIPKMMKAAERRKLENERRIERMVQKERDAEGDMYKDKEVFVTATHRANLERMRKMDEEEARQDALEAVADVTKQPDISAIYRHIYSQTFDKKSVKEESPEADEPGASNSKPIENIDQDEDLSVDSDSERSQSESSSDFEEHGESKEVKKSFSSRKRQYRSRKAEDSDDSEDEQESKVKQRKSEEKEEAEEKIEEPVVAEKDPIEENGESKEVEAVESKVEIEKPKVVKVPKDDKPKVSIWEKRTIGDVFDSALQRYYARKALRSAS